MYILLFGLLLAVGFALVARGVRRSRRGLVWAGGGVLVATIAFFWLMGLWVDVLWFSALGYGRRFWVLFLARLATAAAGFLVGAGGVLLLTRRIRRRLPIFRWLPAAVAGFLGAAVGAAQVETVLRFLHRVETGTADPILGLDVGFYLFVLPFLEAVHQLLFLVVLLAAGHWGAVLFVRNAGSRARRRFSLPESAVEEVRRIGAGDALADGRATLVAAALVLAFGRLLAVPGLLDSRLGAVFGPGWTDVHVRVPALLACAALTLLLGLAAAVAPLRRRLGDVFGAVVSRASLRNLPKPSSDVGRVGSIWAIVFGLWFLLLGVAPTLTQALVVEPNEISFEIPYIDHNIRFTRQAFGLDRMEEREFAFEEELQRDVVEAHSDVLDEVRLWDWRALDAVYKQFQEIRLYYEFKDVDIDRYHLGDRYRQVMVSAREMEPRNLPAASQTFVNRRFKYTHGYGLTLAPVSEFTEEGLPRLLVKDIPPKTEHPELAVERPEIYYGELSRGPVYVNTEEREFDYPRGDENVYTRYEGQGGVELRNLWRKVLFGWEFDGTRLLLSGYPRPETRVLYHRRIHERVRRVAPFLELDEDPYVVLSQGKIYWIVDAYTTARSYPYSQPYESLETIELQNGGRTVQNRVAAHLDGRNYLRNAVKVVVDAYEGSVDLYAFEPDDPVLQVWRSVFPGLFQDRDAMPEALERHVRYPVDLLMVQGRIYAKYHMQDPEVFYNQEDLWVRATEKYYGGVQPVEPYYVMWRPPESDEVEFTLIQPFTPKNRQVLIGWIAGLSDPGSYGRFLSYKFPKEKRILGPQQVETKIDQDRFLSSQLSLWDQRGSQVIRGNVLAIPIAETLLYVEPIYLQAETAAYPELRLVVLMHGDDLSYGESFDEALQGLFEDVERRAPAATGGPGAAPASTRELIRRAGDAFDRYLELQGQGKLVEAARELETLRETLDRLEEPAGSEGGDGENE